MESLDEKSSINGAHIFLSSHIGFFGAVRLGVAAAPQIQLLQRRLAALEKQRHRYRSLVLAQAFAIQLHLRLHLLPVCLPAVDDQLVSGVEGDGVHSSCACPKNLPDDKVRSGQWISVADTR